MQSANFVNHLYDYRPNWTPFSPIKFRKFDSFIASLFPRNSGITAKIDGITKVALLYHRCIDSKSREL